MCFPDNRKIENALVGLCVFVICSDMNILNILNILKTPTHNYHESQGSYEKGQAVIVSLYSLFELNQNWKWQWDLSNILQI